MKKIWLLMVLCSAVLFLPSVASAVPYVYFYGDSYTPSQNFDDGDACNDIARLTSPNPTDRCYDLGGNFNGYYAYVPSQDSVSEYYPTIGECRAANPSSTCFLFSSGLTETCSQGLGACVHSTGCPSLYMGAPGTCPPGYSCCESIDRTCSQAGGACVNNASCPSGYVDVSGGDCAGGYTCCEPDTSDPDDCTSDSGVSGTCAVTCSTGFSQDGQGNCASGQACCVQSSTGGGATGTCKGQGGECRSEGGCLSGEYEDESAVCAPSSYTCCIKQSGSSDPGGGSTVSGSDVFTFNNPLKHDTVQDVLGVALQAMKNVIVLLALVFLVLGAVLYIVSSGNEKMLGAAKKMILAAMIGLAIGIAAPSFLKEIAEILDWGGSGEEIPEEVQEAQTLSEIAENLLNFLLSMVGILGIVMIVVGGLMYFAAAGDEKRADTAKKIILYSIIGVAVALTALIIVRTVASFFVAG